MIVEGVMGGELPWILIIIGALIAVIVEIVGIPVLPFAIGIYLPVQLNACVMIGGLLRLAFEKMKASQEKKDEAVNNGILFCSGMIAGEGIVGIVLALLAIFGVDKMIDLSAKLGLSSGFMTVGGIVLLGVIILTFLKFTLFSKKKVAGEDKK